MTTTMVVNHIHQPSLGDPGRNLSFLFHFVISSLTAEKNSSNVFIGTLAIAVALFGKKGILPIQALVVSFDDFCISWLGLDEKMFWHPNG